MCVTSALHITTHFFIFSRVEWLSVVLVWLFSLMNLINFHWLTWILLPFNNKENLLQGDDLYVI